MQAVFSRLAAKLALAYFLLLSFWWGSIFVRFGSNPSPEHYLFAGTYGLICFWGVFRGLCHSRHWGGFRSIIGRALFFLSLGLLLQEFGQLVFSYYNIFLKVEIPYPSLADVGFFGSIPFYVWGIILLAKASGIGFSLQRPRNLLQIIFIPILMLVGSYYFFLKDYQFDWTQPLKVFLDFGYPFGQAIYISLAIETFTLSRRLLGGLMRGKILLVLLAFVGQFMADYNFLFQTSRGTWQNGGYGDYLYFLSYFLMTLGLIAFYDPGIKRLISALVEKPSQDVFSQAILKIITEQNLIIGPVALEEAARVESIKVSKDLTQVEVRGDPKLALEALVAQYEKLFGRTAVEVSKQVSHDLLSQLPPDQIPDILK